MKIVLTTVGTTGDAQPYLGLATTLKKRGHQVVVCSHDLHADRFRRAGIEFAAVGPSVNIGELNQIFEEARVTKNPHIHFDMVLERVFLREPERTFRDQLAVSADADFVVSHRYDYLGQEAAIRNRKPWASVTLIPNLIPTPDLPPYPYFHTGKFLAGALWEAMKYRNRKSNDRVAAVLAALGSPPRPLSIAGAESPRLNFLAASQALFDERPSWPPKMYVTGSWIFEEPNYQPPRELAEFFEKHAAPIVITFGSMGEANAAKTAEILSTTLAKLRRPAIVQRGYSGFDSLASADTLLVDYVPYDYLFPRAACVVHHAAPGTAYWACRAGVPSVPVPHLFEQFYWAGMLARRGVATKPLEHDELSSKKLTARIESAISSAEMKSKAQLLSAVLREEKGAERAAELIERAV